MNKGAAVFYVRILIGLVLTLALIGLACGEESEDGTGPAETAARENEVADRENAATGEPAADNDTDVEDEADEGDREDVAEPPVGGDAGRLTIGDVTYVFDVDRCELGTDETEIDIRGQGTGPDGRPLTVRASRRGEIDIIRVSTGEGLTVFVSATGTSDVLGGEAPSFRVDGRQVTTRATFYTLEEQERGPEAIGLEGSFVVTCP